MVHGYAGFAALIFGLLSGAKGHKASWGTTQNLALVWAWVIAKIALQTSNGACSTTCSEAWPLL